MTCLQQNVKNFEIRESLSVSSKCYCEENPQTKSPKYAGKHFGYVVPQYILRMNCGKKIKKTKFEALIVTAFHDKIIKNIITAHNKKNCDPVLHPFILQHYEKYQKNDTTFVYFYWFWMLFCFFFSFFFFLI